MSSSCGNWRRRVACCCVRGLGLPVVNGHVDLDPSSRAGLGAHAHTDFGVQVIGVAKTAFRTATHAKPVCGRSARPLFDTAARMPLNAAADLVQHMAGRFRLPDALRRAVPSPAPVIHMCTDQPTLASPD